ncbi:hypothetical protein [Rhizobacter sp. Root1221]|uniref:hypothetical protein n=1 Tax=Rhizobacter sp. Root1221 TaxID=1736433 RepID=UPI0006FFE180|nr:hypothetical protein [Rhizobacter sp. Root1221]KQV91743.1 hypothetical protein ASC87_06630 [Rhizobacter sp. Root1221]
MIALSFEFDLATPGTLALFEQLPQAMAGRSVVIDYRPVAPPAGHAAEPWVRLLVACGAGRWACQQVLHQWTTGSPEAVGAMLAPRGNPAAVVPPAAGGPLPAVVWGDQRFAGPDAINRLLAALPAA